MLSRWSLPAYTSSSQWPWPRPANWRGSTASLLERRTSLGQFIQLRVKSELSKYSQPSRIDKLYINKLVNCTKLRHIQGPSPLTEGLGLQNWTEGELVQTPGHHFFLTWRKRNGHYQPPLTEGLGLQNWTENKRGYEHWILCHQGGTGEAPRRHWNSDWGGTEVGTEGGTDVQNLIPYPYLRVNWSRLDWPHQPSNEYSRHVF